MLSFSPITIDALPSLDRFFSSCNYRICDFTIGGCWMWAEYFGYEYCIEDGILYMRGKDPEGSGKLSYSIPLGEGSLDRGVDRLLEEYGTVSFTTVPEEACEYLCAKYETTSSLLEDWSDYLYSAHSLASLEGHHYSRKRNFIRQFESAYDSYRFEELSKAVIPDVEEFFSHWSKEGMSELALYEDEWTMKILDSYDSFPFEGLVLYVDGLVKAFCIGEVIGDTLFTHIEKGDYSIKGGYQMINKEFAQVMSEKHGIKYINREEDVGDVGLRKAKQSYFPLRMLCKYELEISK